MQRTSLYTIQSLCIISFFLIILRPPRSTLFPYTTLFRSAVLLLELLFVTRTDVVDGRQVDFVERRQQCSRRLRLDETLGDARAQTSHWHALFIARSRRRRQLDRGSRLCGRRLRRRSFLAGHVLHHIALADATVAPAARDLPGVELVFFDHPLRGRRKFRSGCSLRFRGGFWLSSSRGFCGRRLRSGACRALFQDREHLAA